MPTVTFILGLCGAGKSHLAKRIGVDGAVFDEGFLNNQDDHRSLLDHLKRGESCVVVEIAYCIEDERQKIVREITGEVPNVKFNWLCFENDRDTANKNCRERTNKGSPVGHIRINEDYHRLYTIPERGVVLKMWTKDP